MDLSATDAIRLRLAAHGLSTPIAGGPAAVAERTGAVQGQDVRAVTDALAVRAGTTRDEVATAYGADGIVRSWPMRGTLFATTPHRLGQFLSFTGPRLAKELARRRANLGIDDDTMERAARVAADALADGPRPRADVHDAWEADGLQTSGGYAYNYTINLAVRAELWWGPMVGGDHWLGATSAAALGLDAAAEDPDGTLESLLVAYLAGHGPAGVDEAAWWMKLPKTPVRAAADRLGDRLIPVDVEGRRLVVLAEALDELADLPELDPDEVMLLPRFDEWTLGYADRSLVASDAMVEAVDPKRNGQFRRLVVVGGRVVATWERDKARTAVLGPVVEKLTAAQRRRIEAAVAETTLQ